MQASMSEVVLPLDGRDDEVHHSTEMDQIGSSCRDESQLSSQIDDETLEDVDIVIDHALVQYFGTTLPSVTQTEQQPSPPPPPHVTTDDVPVAQELSKTSGLNNFSIDSVEPNLVSIDRYVSAIDSNWDETEAETEFNYYLPSYAQEVVITTEKTTNNLEEVEKCIEAPQFAIATEAEQTNNTTTTTETNSPQAPDKGPSSERLVTAPNDYSLDVIVPEKLVVQGFPFEETLNPLTSTANPNPLQEEYFDDMGLNPAVMKDCRSFYEAQATELSAEGSPVNVSPGCSTMHIVPMSDGMLEVATQSPPEELVGSVGIDVVGKNVIVERNPTASPDVARVPCSNPICQPLSPPPSYRQTMAAAYQKTVYDPLSCCGSYSNVKNQIVLSYSGEGILSETDSRDSDYGPPKLDAIDDNHSVTNDQPNDYPPMLEPADPNFPSSSKVAVHVIPSAAGEALESIRKLSLGVVPENGQEILEGSSQDELNECLGKLVPSITPEFSKAIPSGYIVNDVYNIRNITPESSTIATCVDDVGSLPDLPVSEEPKLYRTFNSSNTRKNNPVSAKNPCSSSELRKSVEKVGSLPFREPVHKLEVSFDLPVGSSKLLVQDPSNSQITSETTVNVLKNHSSAASSSPVEKVGSRVVRVAKNIPQQTLSTLVHDDVMGRANFKIIPTTATTINLGIKKLTIVKPQTKKDKIVLLKPATVKKILASDFESVSNLKKLTPVQSANLEKMLLSQAAIDNKCIVTPIDPKNLPTSSSSFIFKSPKDRNHSAAKGMSKVAVSKGAVALKVSLPLELLSVKPSLTPDVVKSVDCKKDDEIIEIGVNADGDVDPNAVMDAMKVSVPYLFPVTKPEVKKIVKSEVGKVQHPPNSLQAKKKSAAAPVVVKMTSKANRKIFSPIREVDVSLENPNNQAKAQSFKFNSERLEKPDSSLVKTNIIPSRKLEVKGNSNHSEQTSTSGLIIDTTNSPDKTKGITTTKVETAAKSELTNERVVRSVTADFKKRTLEPSLMKQADNASDDLSSFLSSLSGPKERPKGVENLEKVGHNAIKAASAPILEVKSLAPTRSVTTNDPIIIPPIAFRNDDPLSLKVGLKPCKFRQLKKDEESKKPVITQSTRSVPISSSSNLMLDSKPIPVPPQEPVNSAETRPTSTSEIHALPLEESTLENEENSQMKTEEKVHPIVELINQLIESNSKSPQIFSEPDKTCPEKIQMTEKREEGEVQSQKPADELKNKETRAKEDGMLARVVKERTSKLIQKARDLVSDPHVPFSDKKDHSSDMSLTAEQSAQDSEVATIEEASNQIQTNNDISSVKTSMGLKDTKTVDGSVKEAGSLLEHHCTDEVVELPGGVFTGKAHLDVSSKKTDKSHSSHIPSDKAEAQKTIESKSSASLDLREKNMPSESDPLMLIEASIPRESLSMQLSSTKFSISEEELPEELKSEKDEDLEGASKTFELSGKVSPIVDKPMKQAEKQAILKQTLSKAHETADDLVSAGKKPMKLNENKRKNSVSQKMVNSSKKASSTCDPVTISLNPTYLPRMPTNDPVTSSPKPSDLPEKPTSHAVTHSPKIDLPEESPANKSTPLRVKALIVEESPSDNPQTATSDTLVCAEKKLKESDKNTVTDLSRPNKLHEATDVPGGETLGESKFDKVKHCKSPSETTGLSKKLCAPGVDKAKSRELKAEEPISSQEQPNDAVSAYKSCEEFKSKKGGSKREESSDTDSLKKVPSSKVKPPSKPKALKSEEGQPLTKTSSCGSTDDTSKELRGKKVETSDCNSKTAVTLKTPISSKKVNSSTEKLPTQLIVSIPTVVISNQPGSSDLLVSANGNSEVLKGEKEMRIKCSIPTVNPSKKSISSNVEPLKRTKGVIPPTCSEQKTIIVGIPLSACRSNTETNSEQELPAMQFISDLSDKVPLVKNNLKQPTAIDRRTSARRKSIPVGEKKKVAEETLGKVGVLEKPLSQDKQNESNGSNSLKKGNKCSTSHDTSTPLVVLQNVVGDRVKDITEATIVLTENDEHSVKKPADSLNTPEKRSHQIQTRGSVPAPASCETDEERFEGLLKTDKVVEIVIPVDTGSNKADSSSKQPKIVLNDQSSKRPRTRSETSSEKKVLGEGLTEKSEPVVPMVDDNHVPPSIQSSTSQSCVENIVSSTNSQAALVTSLSPKLAEQKQKILDTPTASIRVRGKIDRKPATVKPIPATPKKNGTNLLGNSTSLDSSFVDGGDELDIISPLSTNKLEFKESADVADDNTESKQGNDYRTKRKTPISTRKSSQKKNVFNVTHTHANGNDDLRKPISSVQKLNLSQDPKQHFPKKNLRIPMKPKKVCKLENDVKNLENDVYDFTDDEDQSIKIQTIDHYRKVSGKSSKHTKKITSHFETSQESLLSDDEIKGSNQARRSRNENLKVVEKTKRRASPRKSLSEPRKSESKKGTGGPFKNVTSESTESLLSNSSENVLPAELQENIRNSRNESIRLAKLNRSKKYPAGRLTTSADAEESKSPQPSNTRETRRSSGSRTSSVENLNVAYEKAYAEGKVQSSKEIKIRETRRSSGASLENTQVADVEEVVKVGKSDRIRTKSPLKKDANIADKFGREKISEGSSKVLKSQDIVSANSVNESHFKPDGSSVCHISTRSKSRDSLNEDDTISPRALRNKTTLQSIPVVSGEPKLLKHVEAKSVSKNSEGKGPHKNDKKNYAITNSSNLDPLNNESTVIKLLSTKEGGETGVDKASLNRMITRSSGVPSKTTDNNNYATEKNIPISDDVKFLPKLRSSTNKRLDIFRKTDQEVMEIQSASKSVVHAKDKICEKLPNKMESTSSLMAPEKIKKSKKTDSIIIADSKISQSPTGHILVGISKPLAIATGDGLGKEKHKRAKKGGTACGVNDIILSQPPILSSQDIASRNAEAVSLKTPPMDSNATQELDNIQPVGAMSQNGEPEGAKSSTRTAQLRSLVVPLDEDRCTTNNSTGILRKKNKKLVLEKKKLTQSPEISDNKPIGGEVITRMENDSIIKSGNKSSSVNCLVPSVEFERHNTHPDKDVVSKPGGFLCESKAGETSKSSKLADDVHSSQKMKSTRRITRSSLSSSSPNLDLITLQSTSASQHDLVSFEQNHLSSSSRDLSFPETEPCSSKKHLCSKEESIHILPQNSPSDLVKEKATPKTDLEASNDGKDCSSQIPAAASSPKDELMASKTSNLTRGRKPKSGFEQSDQPLGKDEIESTQPKPPKSEKGKSALVEIITPGPPSGESVPSSERNTNLGESEKSTEKDHSSCSALPTVGRMKTTTKDVCEISGEAKKLFEEANLDGKNGFDVIVPSPGKSPDSTTQNSSEIIIPILSPELDGLLNAKISEDMHGVTSTTELGSVLGDSERKIVVLSENFEVSESSSKKEDENVSSTTLDTKILETNEVESSSEILVSAKRDSLSTESKIIEGESSNCESDLKVLSKMRKFSVETTNLIAEHPKKIWRVNPVLNLLSSSDGVTSEITISSIKNEVSSVVKPHITVEELKKTPLKKRQVWAYSSSCTSNGDIKSKLICKGSSPIEGDTATIHLTNDASPSLEHPKSESVVVGSTNASPEKEVSKRSDEIVCPGKVDGKCPSSVDRLSHSIINILAASTDKVTNEPIVEPSLQATECSKPQLNKNNRKTLVAHSTRSKSKLGNIVKRKINKKSRAMVSLRSAKNRLVQKRHLAPRNFRLKMIKRFKVVQKTGTNHKKLKLSPDLLVAPKNSVNENVNHTHSSEDQVHQCMPSSKSQKSSEVAHSSKIHNVDDNSTISGLSKNVTMHNSNMDDNDSVLLASSVPKCTNVLEPVKQPAKVPSPTLKDKYVELIVDTTNKDIDDEESPPFSPIVVDTMKHSDWNSKSNSVNVESSKPLERSPSAQLQSSCRRDFPDAPLDVPLEDVTYRRSHKIDRVRSNSNDEPIRSHPSSSKARSRRKSHPADNVPVDLSNHVNPVFSMKIPTNIPKLDLSGRTPIYHEALDGPPGPYELIPTTQIRPIPTPPSSYVLPRRHMVVHPIKGNGPIRPIPTLRIPSPVSPYAPITNQFTPPDEMRVELSSRLNAKSAFHFTKKKSLNSNFTGNKKVDYNPLLFAHENNYIPNASLSNVMPSLPSTSTYMNCPSSMIKGNKFHSGGGKMDSPTSILTPSISESGIMNVKSTLSNSSKTSARDMRLHEAQVQLLVTNPELSISRSGTGRKGHSPTPINSGSLDVIPLDTRKPRTSAFNSSCEKINSLSFNHSQHEEILEPLDVVTCELDERSSDSLVHIPRMKVSDITIKTSPSLKQRASKIIPKSIRNELKRTLVSKELPQCREVGVVNMNPMKETVNIEDGTPVIIEKLPLKATSAPRRRISILDADKSYRKNSSAAVVSASLPTAVFETERLSTPSAMVSLKLKEQVNDTKSTKTAEKNDKAHLANSSERSLVIDTENKRSLRKILPSDKQESIKSAETTVSRAKECVPTDGENPNEKILAKPHCTEAVKEPCLVVDGHATRNEVTSEPGATSNKPMVPLEPNVVGPETVKSVVQGIVNSIKEHGRGEQNNTDLVNKLKNVISREEIFHKPVESSVACKTGEITPAQPEPSSDELPKSNSLPPSDSKITDVRVAQSVEVVEKSEPETNQLELSHITLLTEKISKSSSEPVDDGKPGESSVGQKPGVVEKSIPQPKTDVNNECSSDGKLINSSVTQKPTFIEKSDLTLETANVSKPLPHESSIERQSGVVAKSVSYKKTAEISVSSYEPVNDIKPNKLSFGNEPPAVGKSISQSKSDEILRPCSEPIITTSGKLYKSSNKLNPDVVEESILQLKTDKLQKSSSQPKTNGKLIDPIIGKELSVVGKLDAKPTYVQTQTSHSVLKTDEIPKGSPQPITDGKLNDATIGKGTVLECPISMQESDYSKSSPSHTQQNTEQILQPSYGPLTDNKHKKGDVVPQTEVVEKCIPKLADDQTLLKTDKVSKPSLEPIMDNILKNTNIQLLKTDHISKSSYESRCDGGQKDFEPLCEVVETFISEPKSNALEAILAQPKMRTDTDTKPILNAVELENSDTKLDAKIPENPSPKPKTEEKSGGTDDKPNNSFVGPRAIEKCISELITEKHAVAPLNHSKPTKPITNQKLNDCLVTVKMDIIPPNVDSLSKPDDDKAVTHSVALKKLSEPLSNLRIGYKLEENMTEPQTGESLKSPIDELKTGHTETRGVEFNEDKQSAVGMLEPKIINSVGQRVSDCPNIPTEECLAKAETARMLANETEVHQVSDTLTTVKNCQEGLLKASKMPLSHDINQETPTENLPLSNQSLLPQTGLFSLPTSKESSQVEETYNSNNCPNESKKHAVLSINEAIVKNETKKHFSMPAIKDHLPDSSKKPLADSVPIKNLHVIKTRPDSSLGKESKQNESKNVDDEASGVSLLEQNYPTTNESGKQKGVEETISSVICATSVPSKVQKKAKNMVHSAVAELIDQNIEGKRGIEDYDKSSKVIVDTESLDLKANPIKEKDETFCNVVTGVAKPSESIKSVLYSAAGDQTKGQDAGDVDFGSNEPLSLGKTEDGSVQTALSYKNDAQKEQVTPPNPYLDAHKSQEHTNDKLAHDTDKLKSSLSNDSVENGPTSPPEPDTVNQLLAIRLDDNVIPTEKPDSNPNSDKSHPASNVGPSGLQKKSEAETLPHAPVERVSTETANITDAEHKQIADRPNTCYDSLDEVTPSAYSSIFKPVFANLNGESALNAQHKEESISLVCSSKNSSEPDPDHGAAAGDLNASNPTTIPKNLDNVEVQESSSKTAVVDTEEAAPNSTSETCAIVQSSVSPLFLPSDSTKDSCKTASSSITRPERKRKRPAWWSSDEDAAASKLHKINAMSPEKQVFEVDCPGEHGDRIKIDPSIPKVEVELLCQSVIKKLQESLGISIDQIDLAKLRKYWEEFHSSFSRDVLVQRAQGSQSDVASRKSPSERLSVSANHALPSTSSDNSATINSPEHARPSTSSDYSATIHSPASIPWMEKKDDDIPRNLVAILHERGELAKQFQLKPPTKRGEKRTVSQAFAQNVYIYKDPRVNRRSNFERTSGGDRRSLWTYGVPLRVLTGRTPSRQPPPLSYSWILEHLRERRKKNQHHESTIPAQPCKDFMRPQEEHARPSLKEVYRNSAEGHTAPILGYSRVSPVHEVPLPASSSSSTTSRIPTLTFSSYSEDSNPGNPEDTVDERDEVRRRIRRKPNTPSISSCSCPQPGHGSNKTTCPSCRRERYHSPGASSLIQSSRPFYNEISHLERAESAWVRGNRAATVGGGDDFITISDSEAAVRYLKGVLATSWPSDLDTSNDEPPIRNAFTSYQEDVSPSHVTVSPCPPPQSSSSAHPPPDTERATGASFQICLQQKPLSERRHPENNNDNVQHGSVNSTERQISLLPHSGTTTGQLRAAFPAKNMRVAGSRYGRNSGAETDPSARSHGSTAQHHLRSPMIGSRPKYSLRKDKSYH